MMFLPWPWTLSWRQVYISFFSLACIDHWIRKHGHWSRQVISISVGMLESASCSIESGNSKRQFILLLLQEVNMNKYNHEITCRNCVFLEKEDFSVLAELCPLLDCLPGSEFFSSLLHLRREPLGRKFHKIDCNLKLDYYFTLLGSRRCQFASL